MHFVQRGKPTQSAPLEYSANLNDGSDVTLIDVARDALAKAGAGSPTGKVKVFAGKLSGTLWVDGKQVGQMTDGKGELDAIAGTHKIVLKAAGGSEIASEFKMAPLGETTVILSPPPPAVAGFDGKIAVGFGLVAIGVGFAAGGVYSTVRLHSIQGDFDDHFKANYGRSQDACTTKRQPLPLDHNRVLDLCNEASTLKDDPVRLLSHRGGSCGRGVHLARCRQLAPRSAAQGCIDRHRAVCRSRWRRDDGANALLSAPCRCVS